MERVTIHVSLVNVVRLESVFAVLAKSVVEHVSIHSSIPSTVVYVGTPVL